MVTETTIEVSAPAPRPRSWRVRLHALYLRSDTLKGFTLLSPTLLVMGLTMCIPFGIMVVMSFWTQIGFEFDTAFSLVNYVEAVEKPMYRALLLRSLTISAICTVATVLLSYPMAYYVAFHVRKHKMAWIILMTVPFFSSYLLRIFAWKVILGYNGVINSGLKSLGLLSEPLEFLLYNPTSVIITLAHAWAAFAILPIYVSLEKIDRSLLEASRDLGENTFMTFVRVTLPLSLPGVIAASLLVFIPTVGDYVTPSLVGGPSGIMIGNIIQSMFGKAQNWPLGAAISVMSMLTVTLMVSLFLWGTDNFRRRIA